MDTKIYWWGERQRCEAAHQAMQVTVLTFSTLFWTPTRHILTAIFPIGVQERQTLMDKILGEEWQKCGTIHRAIPLGVRAFSMLFRILKLTHLKKRFPLDLLELEISKNI